MVTDLINTILDKGVTVGIIIIAAGLVGLVQVGLQMIVAINGKFEHAESVMIAEVAALKEGIIKIAFALMRVSDDELRKALMESVERLQEKK